MNYLHGNLPFSHVEFDLEKMDSKWRKEFIDEVESGNFVRGGRSIVLVGPGAETGILEWLACLLLANYRAFRLTPYEAVCRMLARPVYNDTPDRLEDFLNAECIVIDDFFQPIPEQYLYEFETFLRQAIRDGVVVLVGTESDETAPSGNLIEILEAHFEAIRVETNQKKTDKSKARAGGKRDGEDSGADSTRRRFGRSKHKGSS